MFPKPQKIMTNTEQMFSYAVLSSKKSIGISWTPEQLQTFLKQLTEIDLHGKLWKTYIPGHSKTGKVGWYNQNVESREGVGAQQSMGSSEALRNQREYNFFTGALKVQWSKDPMRNEHLRNSSRILKTAWIWPVVTSLFEEPDGGK